MERFFDRPVQFNSKASEATLQTCSAWLHVLKSLVCIYVLWQTAFFSTVQLIFLSLSGLQSCSAFELDVKLDSRLFTLSTSLKTIMLMTAATKYRELTRHGVLLWKLITTRYFMTPFNRCLDTFFVWLCLILKYFPFNIATNFHKWMRK